MKSLLMITLFSVFFGPSIICSWEMQMQIQRCPTLRLNNGRIRIRRGRIARFSCNVGFTLVGNRYATCERGHWDTPIPVCVNAECPPLSAPAHSFKATKVNGAIVMFFCEPGYALIGNSEIYCDGHQWNASTPFCRDTTASAPTKCDFETPDLCWWQQDPLHDFDWKRHNFETPSLHIGTGPTHDHTLGAGNDGYYLYIEASGRLVNDTARIISPLYNYSLTATGCFSLWYHMYGATIGSLNIYFKQEDAAPRLMFTKSGNQGNQWFHGSFDLPKSNISFQIIIEGVRGNTYVSDIAIDDVAILQGSKCIVKNDSTNVTADYYDQIEIVNSQQTCRNRCVYSLTESSVSSERPPGFGPENCLCTFDCTERAICCPDFAEYCILGDTTTPIMLDITTRTQSGNITTAPVRNSTLTGFPINPKDDIDPGMTNSTTSTITRRPIVTTKTTVKAQTRKPPRMTVPVKPTQQAETKETPFEPKTILTTEYVELRDRSDSHNAEQNQEKVKHGFYTLEIVVAIGTTLCVLSLALAITIFAIRRRKSYKKGTNGSALSEDSDVRFLTSDEILDFNLARPTDNDEI